MNSIAAKSERSVLNVVAVVEVFVMMLEATSETGPGMMRIEYML